MITIKLYANLREVAGKEVSLEGEGTLREVLEKLFQKYPSLRDTILEGDKLRPHFSVLLNGRNVIHLRGLETWVKEEDEIAIFPPVAGGVGNPLLKTVDVRGVPKWAVKGYLLDMGARAVDDMYRCEEEGWTAKILDRGPAGTRVELTGPPERITEIEKRLRLKCLRAGG